jgi:hypothetical protein
VNRFERAASRSLHSALRVLREGGVCNPHRLLVPLPTGRLVLPALRAWAREFRGLDFRIRGVR